MSFLKFTYRLDADAVSEREVLMKWFPPLVELSRAAVRHSLRLRFVDAFLVAGLVPVIAGCSALPSMSSAPVHVAMTDLASGSDQ